MHCLVKLERVRVFRLNGTFDDLRLLMCASFDVNRNRQLAQTIADIDVRSYTFQSITPAMTDEYKIPNACTTCHTDKTTQWARETMKGWLNVSPWRVN